MESGDQPNTAEATEELKTKTEVEKVDATQRRVKATVPREKVTSQLADNYRELSTTVQLPGFRKGRIPRRLLEKRFGDEINSEVKGSLLNEAFAELVKDEEFKIFGSPRFENVEFSQDSDFTFEVEFDVRPEFELPKYKGLEVDGEAVEVSDEDIDTELDKIRGQNAKWVDSSVEKPGAEHMLIGDYTISVDGEVVHEKDKASFKPESTYLDMFHVEDLVDKVDAWNPADGPLTIEAEIPGFFEKEELRGQKASVSFNLDTVQEQELPALDEEFAKSVNRESVDKLKDDIREMISDQRQREVDAKVEAALVEKLVESTSMELTDEFLKRHSGLNEDAEEAHTHSHDHEDGEHSHSHDHADEEESSEGGEDSESAEGEEGEKAEKFDPEKLRGEIKQHFVLEAVGEKEKIFATEDDLRQRVQMMASMYGMSGGDLLENLRSSGRLDEMRFGLRVEKIKAFLRKKAKVQGLEEASAEGAGAKGDSAEGGDSEDAGSES